MYLEKEKRRTDQKKGTGSVETSRDRRSFTIMNHATPVTLVLITSMVTIIPDLDGRPCFEAKMTLICTSPGHDGRQ
jgi:hypothetical protein